MNARGLHPIGVIEIYQIDDRLLFRSTCTCDWTGSTRSNEWNAMDEYRKHRKEAHA